MDHTTTGETEVSSGLGKEDDRCLPSQAETEIGSLANTAHGGSQGKPLCRFYVQDKACRFGKRCRFLHQLDDVKETPIMSEKRTNRGPDGESQGEEIVSLASLTQQLSGLTESPGEVAPGHIARRPPTAKRQRATRPCRYFLSGFCAMEGRCRFLHPQQFVSVEDPPCPEGRSVPKRRDPLCHPGPIQEVKINDLTDEVTKQLRDTEISQLLKRFPKDQIIVQEREDGLLTYYRLTVKPTDPDWPFDLKEIDIMISFPDNYPKEVFTVAVPEDQDLPSVMGRHVQQASLQWLQAKHATNGLMGKVELLFRPFLRWLDRSMERIFTEGARQLKKDIDIERAGIRFVPYQELQATVGKESAGMPMEENTEPHSASSADEEEEEEKEQEEDRRQVENVKVSEPRRGTEVKLLGLRLGVGTATAVARRITVTLQCSRCKVAADLTLSGRLPCSAQCEKCRAGLNASFRPSMLHLFSDVLGYLDLGPTNPVDLVLQDCELLVGCLSCSKESLVESVMYGQNKEFNCEHCHSKLSLFIESTRFQYIQPRSRSQTGQGDSALYQRNTRNPAIQLGKPLPEKGSCRHFKQSHRWLRFPCCGRAYPCDVCHDEDQDHPWELATRMICGLCAKEQTYSNAKPCVSCGGMMTRDGRTSHWEGGLGCRNKVKMSRNDRHKYVNTIKTVSRKASSDKK